MYQQVSSYSFTELLTNNVYYFSDLFERESVQEENSGFYIPVSIVDSHQESSANMQHYL
jgi:hypothetical protein